MHQSKQKVLLLYQPGLTLLFTLNEVKAEALVYTQAFKFQQVEAKSVTVTLVESISYTLSVRQ